MSKIGLLTFFIVSGLFGSDPNSSNTEFKFKEDNPVYLWSGAPDKLKLGYCYDFIRNYEDQLRLYYDDQGGYSLEMVRLKYCIDSIYIDEIYNSNSLGLTTLGCASLLGWFK